MTDTVTLRCFGGPIDGDLIDVPADRHKPLDVFLYGRTWRSYHRDGDRLAWREENPDD